MDARQQKVLKTFSPRNIAIATIIGLGGTFWMLYNALKDEGFDKLQVLGNPNYFWLFLAFITMVVRDLGYMYRIKTITGNEVSWKGSWYIIILWEFASAVTPSVVGGTMVAVFILNYEGIKPGKAMAYTMLTAALDNTFFLVASPIVLLITGWDIIPEFAISVESMNMTITNHTIIWAFQISYLLIAFYSLIMVLGTLIIPTKFKGLLFWFAKVFKMPGKIKRKIINFGLEMQQTSHELKGHNFMYWAKVTTSTAFVWSARYFILNCLLVAFLGPIDHPLVFSKQVIMWITQLVSPTPGASGAAELVFREVYMGTGGVKDYSVLTMIAFIWRLATYYPYLILGIIFLPRWLKRVFVKTGTDLQK